MIGDHWRLISAAASAARVSSAGRRDELDDHLVERAGERERRAVPVRHRRAVVVADARADRRDHPHEQRRGRPGRAATPSTASVDACPRMPSPRRNRTPSVDVAGGHRDVGLDDRVVAERVVVDHQAVVLHEHRDARVLGAGGEEHALVAGGRVTVRREVEAAPADGGAPPGPAAATSAAGTRSGGRPGAASGRGSGRRTARSSRSSSGSTPWRSASAHHSSISSASLLGLRRGEVVALGRGRRRGGTAPTARSSKSAPGCVACTPPSSRRRTMPRWPIISKYCTVLRGRRAPASCEDAGERVPGDRASARRPRYTSGGVDADELVDRRHDVGDVDELVARRARAGRRRCRPASARSAARGRRPRGCSACTT